MLLPASTRVSRIPAAVVNRKITCRSTHPVLPQARCECGKAAADSENLIQQAIGAGACEALENPLDRTG
jgi:hypothetical protein